MLATEQKPKSARRWSAWTASLLFHVAVVTVLMSVHSGPPPSPMDRHKEVFTPLVYRPYHPTQRIIVPIALTRPPLIAHPKMPTPVIARQMPQAMPRAAEPKAATIAAPVLLAAMPADVPDHVQLKTAELPSRPPAPVKTGLFSGPGQAANAPVVAARLEIQTGGFGEVPATAPSGKGNGGAVQTGGFGTAVATTGSGRGGGGSGVHTGGFGDAGSGGGGTGGNGRAVVASAGFGNANVPVVPVRRVETPAAPAETPVEVLWKPKPVYTAEAREKKLEGNVTLEVVFRASGDVQVLRVLRGLGFGLDESARTAAQQIRFRPSKRDGVPVDRTGTVMITFELS